jgi:endonuclease/exonuclease/phosphatase family metal-dependent hydrolase
MSYSASTAEECTPPPRTDNFDRYSKFLVKNSNGVDGMGWGGGGRSRTTSGEADGITVEGGAEETLVWVDTLLGDGDGRDDGGPRRPSSFSVLSWNILAQSLYEAQYQKLRMQQVALSSSSSSSSSPEAPRPHQLPTTPHPHPWPRRLRRIVEVLSRARADIVCLQECEYVSYRDDLAPAMHAMGYDGISQEDDRPDAPTRLRETSKKHREPRHHIAATFWRRDKFVPLGESYARSRTLTTVLRLRGRRRRRSDDDGDNMCDDGGGGWDDSRRGATTTTTTTMPTVAVVNAHLEGHPHRFLERTHQLQHALTDLAWRVVRREDDDDARPSGTKTDAAAAAAAGGGGGATTIDGLNALIVAGDFNCELQSSACSTYLRMGRLGRQAGFGGVHGEDSIVLPPSLLETTEAMEVIHPIVEWGRALPEEAIADVGPHPFRRSGLTSAYPAWLGRDDPRTHFTFCSESSKHPVPGLDQIWFTSMTLERVGLRRMFVDDSSSSWERYFYDDVEVERRREDERRGVLATGLPSPGCEYPSDHLPIGAIFRWKRDESRRGDDGAVCGALHVVDAEGNDVQTLAESSKQRTQMQEHAFANPREELDYLVEYCPYDSDEQRSDVQFVLSPIDPPLSLASSERPTPDQMMQLDARHATKAKLAAMASLSVRPWLKNIWKVNKQVGKWGIDKSSWRKI